MTSAKDVLDFWLNEVGPEGWYVSSDSVDDEIRMRFSDMVERAIAGELDGWAESANGALALLILLDQFPRNLHRGSAKAFSGDARALDIARKAICRNIDLETSEPGRQFFYLPFEHSESPANQDWAVALFETRTPSLPEEALWHAKQHRDVILKFGRFPYRNVALGRESTAEELAYLGGDGYKPGTAK